MRPSVCVALHSTSPFICIFMQGHQQTEWRHTHFPAATESLWRPDASTPFVAQIHSSPFNVSMSAWYHVSSLCVGIKQRNVGMGDWCNIAIYSAKTATTHSNPLQKLFFNFWTSKSLMDRDSGGDIAIWRSWWLPFYLVNLDTFRNC